MTLQDYLKEKTELLERSGVEDAENEAWVILMSLTDLNRTQIRFSLAKELDDCLSAETLWKLEDVWVRRADREPLAYIIGKAPFYDLEFDVGSGVLIPRFDTEILVETALASLGCEVMLPHAEEVPQVEQDAADFIEEAIVPDNCNEDNTVTNIEISGVPAVIRVFDLCTGSGCVGITIAHELMRRGIPFELVMTEISEEAAHYATTNAERILGDNDWKVELVDLWPSINEEWEKADLIVSNPPYITKEEMEDLALEVRDKEPSLALTDGGDGLTLYRRICAELPSYLRQGGVLAVEHGCDQGEAVRDLMHPVLRNVGTIQDYGGHDRVTFGRRESQAKQFE